MFKPEDARHGKGESAQKPREKAGYKYLNK